MVDVQLRRRLRKRPARPSIANHTMRRWAPVPAVAGPPARACSNCVTESVIESSITERLAQPG